MALFMMERYLGEEEEEDGSVEKSQALNILEQINAQAKKDRCSKTSPKTPQTERDEKKRKEVSADTVISKEPQKDRKKKKKNKQNDTSTLDQSLSCDISDVEDTSFNRSISVANCDSQKKARKRNSDKISASENEHREKVKHTPKSQSKCNTSQIDFDVSLTSSSKKKILSESRSKPIKAVKLKGGKPKSDTESSSDSESESDETDNNKSLFVNKLNNLTDNLSGEKLPNGKTHGVSSMEVDETESESDTEIDKEINLVKSMDQSNTKGHAEEVGGFTVLGDVRHKKIQKVHRVLPGWLAHPSVIKNDLKNNRTPLTAIPGLDDDLLHRLRENNINDFFPVQSQVIPVLLSSTNPFYRAHDICCSAPTGSGKTLAFAIPIIQALRHRVVCRVRALVVLPVRDLATQVYKVFQTYAAGTPLKVGLIIGQKTFTSEQKTLVKKGVQGYSSLVDIIVATPGRLTDHINQTKGFSLSHLRFLAIDEADRMMDEIKQDWLAKVEHAVYEGGSTASGTAGSFVRNRPGPLNAANIAKGELPLQKLLFSATLSQNPEKLQQLNLFQPKLFTSVVTKTSKSSESMDNKAVDQDADMKNKGGEFIGKYTTPAGLTEYFVEASPQEKPLFILYFLHQLKFRHILVFTNSVEATHRLFLLVKLFGDIEVREFSSNLHAIKRARLLKQFESGKIDILICSDAMARGMDVERVNYVISYEAPPFVKTYIHRVGRTARAGKAGTAITLLDRKEIFHFKKIMSAAGKPKILELKVTKPNLRTLVDHYKTTLKKLEEVMKVEKKKK